VLVRQGRLRVDQPVNAPEWDDRNDPRKKITLEDLLRMQSGIDAAETQSPFDPVAQMEYTEPDMAGFAARRTLKAPPRTVWEYTSANTLILAREIGRAIGGGAAGMRTFAQEELFAPLHMRSVTMEFDGQGIFFGSTYVYATARDYARFGELYVNDGVSPGGLGAPYGAGFFTNDGPSKLAALRVKYGFPKDGFFASGVLGQRIYIVPSARIVVARFAYSRPPDFGIEDDLALIKAAVGAAGSTVAQYTDRTSRTTPRVTDPSTFRR
jgi:CubicO group peptidase (beta-lactamase class C family)